MDDLSVAWCDACCLFHGARRATPLFTGPACHGGQIQVYGYIGRLGNFSFFLPRVSVYPNVDPSVESAVSRLNENYTPPHAWSSCFSGLRQRYGADLPWNIHHVSTHHERPKLLLSPHLEQGNMRHGGALLDSHLLRSAVRVCVGHRS